MKDKRERVGWRLSSSVQIALFALFVVLALVLPFVPPARAATVNVSIVELQFQPSTINVQLGDTVIWTNNGALTHTVTSDGGAGPLDSGDIGSSGTYSHTFVSEGTYSYHCVHHPSMQGTVTVGSAIPEYSSTALVALGLMVILIGLVAVGKNR
jgi:plastocyanin